MLPRMYTISVVLKEHGANGPNARGSREERTHSQAAQTCAALETQKIRRDSFVLKANFVEAAGRTDSVTDMTLQYVCYSCLQLWGSFKLQASRPALAFSAFDRSTAGTSSSLIITAISITFKSRCCVVYTVPLTTEKYKSSPPNTHSCPA